MNDRSGIKRHQNLKPGSSAEQQKDTKNKIERLAACKILTPNKIKI